MKLSQQTIEQWNERIRITRSMLYKQYSDEWFIAWQKYLSLGKTDEAEAAKQKWLAIVEDIDTTNPYYDIEESDAILTAETKKQSTETVTEEVASDVTETTSDTTVDETTDTTVEA